MAKNKPKLPELPNLAEMPAAVVRELIDRTSERQVETYQQYDLMLEDVELDDETKLVILGRKADLTRQMTELASTIASTFGRQASKGPISNIPAPGMLPIIGSPPIPGQPMVASIEPVTGEPA